VRKKKLEHIRKVIATGLNVQKELEKMQYCSLEQQMSQLDADVVRQIEHVGNVSYMIISVCMECDG